ncbi:MAG: hypothetical protein JWN76_246 [Chitinophagaceae bacterium]|nr:hypothetical protein [Chitinophagaceae bacterium]
MKLVCWLAFAIMLFFLSNTLNAQDIGGFPPSTKWKQINTDTVRVIFTDPALAQAKRIATLVERMAAERPVTLGEKLKKINIVLHNNTTLANGYVTLGPRRSEYYLVPGSNNFEFGNLPWYENLAVHEYRHVQQFNNFNHGISRLFSFLFGQQGQLLANSIAVPDWFFEGDAVYAESAFTGMGRGRQPLFINTYKSLWLDNKNYSWMKLRNDSYKDFVPNHYYLGYLLVNYGYLKYGPAFWQKVTRRAVDFEGIIYPFQHAVQKETGMSFKNFYKGAVNYYQKQLVNHTPPKEITKEYTNFYFPQHISKDSVLFLEESFKKRQRFYIQTPTGKHFIKLKDIGTEEWFTYRNGQVAYTAYQPHPRWSLVDYSNIMLLDIHSGKKTKLTNKGKYFNPDISPDGKSVMAISINDSLQTELHILDAASGFLIKKIMPSQGEYFIQPKYIDNSNSILGIRYNDGTMNLSTLQIANGTRQALTGNQHFAMGNFYVNSDTVYFTASYTGNDELFALNLNNQKIYQLTDSEIGNYFPAVSGNQVTWSAFTANGYQMQSAALNEMKWKQVSFPGNYVQGKLYDVADAHKNVLETPTRDFAVKKFPKTTGLINIHSWDPSSLTVYSNNILNTLALELSYTPDYTDHSGTISFTALYGGFFPVITAGVDYITNHRITLNGTDFNINQTEAKLGYYIPLNFTGGVSVKNLAFGSSFIHSKINTDNKNVSFKTRSYLSHFISWSHTSIRARQQAYPRLGYSISSSFRHELDRKATQWNTDVSFYLPGLSTNHNLIFTANYQRIDTSHILFSTEHKLARGYKNYVFPRMFTPTVNYHLPVAYPDWGFANLIYFARVRANIFFDRSYVRINNSTKDHFSSTGVNMLFDTKVFNALEVTLGGQYSYLLNKKYAGSKRHIVDFTLGLPF